MENIKPALRGQYDTSEEDSLSFDLSSHSPKDNSATQLREFGMDILKTGRVQEALDWFQKSVEAAPDDSLSHYLCAIAFKALDQSDDARREWQTILSLPQRDDHDRWAHLKAQEMLAMSR